MPNQNQIDYWNGPAGQKWVDESTRLDRMLAPFAERVLSVAHLNNGEFVLDVGCGAGALSLKAAEQVGNSKGVLGIDVSEPLLALAQRRADEVGAPARFLQADASQYVTDQAADAMISRFGVMFFDDPIAAFQNLRQSLRSGGRLTFACWQHLSQNDWAFAPLQAAMPFLKEPPEPTDPNAPGPFAFHDKDRLEGILSGAAWDAIEIEPVEIDMVLPGKDVEDSASFMLQLGPLSRLLKAQDVDPEPVKAALVDLMKQHQTESGAVAMKSASWLLRATKP